MLDLLNALVHTVEYNQLVLNGTIPTPRKCIPSFDRTNLFELTRLHESIYPHLRGLKFSSSQGLIWLSSGESFSLAAISYMTYNCNGIKVFDLFLNHVFQQDNGNFIKC